MLTELGARFKARATELNARIEGRTSKAEQAQLIHRRGMSVLAAAFPVAFIVSSLVLHRTEFQTSLSAYYWTLDPERNFFVGVLCAVGVFLLLYKGYSELEDRVLDAAGLAAVGIAFFPMVKGSDCVSSGGISFHGVSAVIFFACIFYVCIFMSRNSLRDVPDPERRAAFLRAYKWCSGIMIGCVVLALVARIVPQPLSQKLCENSIIFWIEAFGVWAFSAFWYIKTRELDPRMSWIPFRRNLDAGTAAQ